MKIKGLTISQWMHVIFKSKTMIFAMLLAVFGAIADQLEVIQPFLTPENFSKFSSVIAVAMMVLRFITNTALTDKIQDVEKQIEDAAKENAGTDVADSEIVEEGPLPPTDQKA